MANKLIMPINLTQGFVLDKDKLPVMQSLTISTADTTYLQGVEMLLD